MRVLIALEENSGMDSRVSSHFGHAPFFAVWDTETKTLDIFENELEHSGPVTPVDQIMQHKPDLVYTLGIGHRALRLFAEKGVVVKTGGFNRVREVLENLDKLEDMESDCGH